MRTADFCLVFAALLVSACGKDEAAPLPQAQRQVPPEGWRTINAGGVFSFSAPPTLVQIPAQAIDSFARRYNGEHFGLTFDYGPYTGPFGPDSANGSRFTSKATLESLVIDGRKAMILSGRGSGGCAMLVDLFVAGPSKEQNLSMSGCADETGFAELGKLYRSIDFDPPTAALP